MSYTLSTRTGLGLFDMSKDMKIKHNNDTNENVFL